MEAKLITDLNMSAYHQENEHLSKSALAYMLDCPAKFKHFVLDGNRTDSSDSLHFSLGTAVHTLATEPDEWNKNFYVAPSHIKRRGTKEWKEIEADAGNRFILKGDEFEQVGGMAAAMKENPISKRMLSGSGYVEATIMFEYKGVKLKCRPDVMRSDGLIVDVKTAKSARPEFFFKDAYSYHYDMSVAITSLGYKALYGKMPDDYVFCVVEKEAPYIVQCYNSFTCPTQDGVPECSSFFELGMSRLDKAIEEYKACVASGVWDGYVKGIAPVKMPKFAEKDVTHVEEV